MANEESKSYPMVGGHGPTSYAQNSTYQKAVVDASKGLLYEGIMEKLDFQNMNFDVSNQFLIADYGCSNGPNTFLAVQNVIEFIKLKYNFQCPNNPPLEFLVFFSDHIENDFNTLFKTLPPNKDYFALGLPGNFHKQLLPRSFLHFVHCSSSLHWLSMVPKEVTDNTSLAWNKDSIICSGSNKDVKQAFLAQFNNDFNMFLNARAKEITIDGIMIIQIPSVPKGVMLSETPIGMIYECLAAAMTDLTEIGIIAKEELYSFNLPMYYPTAEELGDIIKKNGYFNIEKMETLDNILYCIKLCPQIVLLAIRAVVEGPITKHFEDEIIVEKVFQHYAKKLEENFSMIEGSTKSSTDIFIMLKRKLDS